MPTVVWVWNLVSGSDTGKTRFQNRTLRRLRGAWRDDVTNNSKANTNEITARLRDTRTWLNRYSIPRESLVSWNTFSPCAPTPTGNNIKTVRTQGSQICLLRDLSATPRHAAHFTPQEGVRRPQHIVSILLDYSHSVFLSFERLLMCNKTELIDINYSPDEYLRRQTPPGFFFFQDGEAINQLTARGSGGQQLRGRGVFGVH